MPLDERGYGYLMERTAVGARALYDALSTAETTPFTIVTLPAPDLNIVCFLVMPLGEAALHEINALNEGIYHSLSVQHPYDTPDYVISRTVLRSPVYRGVVQPLLGRIDRRLLDEWPEEGLVAQGGRDGPVSRHERTGFTARGRFRPGNPVGGSWGGSAVRVADTLIVGAVWLAAAPRGRFRVQPPVA